MAIKPYYTSNDLIEAVKRKIAMPISQETFTEDDILAFANEEMFISQVPSVLSYNQEYFVYQVEVPLVSGQNRYPIPDRAIGMRIRDVSFKDESNNLVELTRIDLGDSAFFQGIDATISTIHKFYLEGNDIVLIPFDNIETGSLVFSIYLRPNQLVSDDQAAVLTSITEATSAIQKNLLANSTYVQVEPTNTITITDHGFADGNKLVFSSTDELPEGISSGDTYYVVNATTDTFQISTSVGGSAVSIISVGSGIHTVQRNLTLTEEFLPSAVNFADDTINIPNHDLAEDDKVLLSSTGTLPSPLVENNIYYVVSATANSIKLSMSVGGDPIDLTLIGSGEHTITADITTLNFNQVPEEIVDGSLIDFLQTKAGHRTYTYDITIPQNGVSGSSILIPATDVPDNFIVGDYVCLANQCIIPQIPSDLHNGLAERTCARLLASLGDQAGLQISEAKLGQIDRAQGQLLGNRTESAPQKVLNKNSLLRIGRNRRL